MTKRHASKSLFFPLKLLFRFVFIFVGLFSVLGWIIKKLGLDISEGGKTSNPSVSKSTTSNLSQFASNKESVDRERDENVDDNKELNVHSVSGLIVEKRDSGLSSNRSNRSNRNVISVKTTKNLRQRRILSMIERKGEVTMSDVKKIFPGVNERTVRRDFELLVNKGILVKEGTTRATVYKSKV